MGTSARAAKRRMDSIDTGPIRIEGTDTCNQPLQHLYQNFRQVLDDPPPATDAPPEARASFSAKRDFFEQRFKTPPPTYDSPPRQQAQKIITTITTTSTSARSNVPDRTSSSSNESPSVDRVLEQAVELQKLSHINATKNDAQQQPVVVERSEQYQVFLDSLNHEVRRTASISRTSVVPVTKTGHATDLDQAQAQIERLTDDHQAIQKLTRALQEHNQATTNEYKRLPSQTNTAPSSPLLAPSSALHDRTNVPVASEFAVIDALLNNPLGSTDDKCNYSSQQRSNDIVSNLHKPDFIHSLKESTVTRKESNSRKKSKDKKTAATMETTEPAALTPIAPPPEAPLAAKAAEPTVTSSTEKTPLIEPKAKTKPPKENKKKAKPKSKQKSINGDYQVIDAIISSPISLRLPDSYLTKYKVSPPLSQSSPLLSLLPTTSSPVVTTSTAPKDHPVSTLDKNQTLFNLARIVHELHLHHAAALLASTTISAPSKINTNIESKDSLASTKRSVAAAGTANETVRQQSSREQKQQPQEMRQKPEPIKPRIIYRYIDEQGRVLKMSSIPPSQLREQPSQQYAYPHNEPAHFYGRHIAVDDERRHPLPQYEQRATWQGESKLPTTLTREDFELRDKRVPLLSDQAVPMTRTIPVSLERDYASRIPSQQQQQRTYQYPNQPNVKLAWLPLSYQAEQQYMPSGAAGYDTDSTISERSGTYRPYDYAPIDSHYRYSNRPLFYNDHHHNRSPGPSYYPPPPSLPYGGRGISPDYATSGAGGLSRNYIEVFRGGDFRETKPSEIYSLPLSDHLRTSPVLSASNRHSRYDQYQSEKYGTMSHRPGMPSSLSQPNYHYSNPRYHPSVPPAPPTVYYTHRSPQHHHRTVQSSPNPDYSNYLRQSRSFDYRPLRTKLQREYKITPNLLVDEWDYPSTPEKMKYSTTSATTTTNRSGVSSPDDVFITNRTNIS